MKYKSFGMSIRFKDELLPKDKRGFPHNLIRKNNWQGIVTWGDLYIRMTQKAREEMEREYEKVIWGESL